MVKVNAPMLSLDASGSIAGAIVFSKWKGRNYARELVRPANPKSVLQVSMRAMMRFLSQAWATVGTTPRGSWLEEADAGKFSTFNAFIQGNQRRWREFLPPSQTQPSPGTGTQPLAAFASATGGVRHIDLAGTVTTLFDGWGAMIFRSPTGSFTPSISNCIRIIPIPTSGAWAYTDSNLLPGTYFYDVKFFVKEGIMGPDEGEQSGTAT